jgi:hypothetical protein
MNPNTENPRVGGSTEARSADRRTKCELAKPALHSAPGHHSFQTLLAAVLPNPRYLRVDDPSPYLRERQSWIPRIQG